MIVLNFQAPSRHSNGSRKSIIGYEFYWQDEIGGYDFVGMVTERRKDPARITDESIINLGRTIFGEHADVSKILVIPIKLGHMGEQI